MEQYRGNFRRVLSSTAKWHTEWLLEMSQLPSLYRWVTMKMTLIRTSTPRACFDGDTRLAWRGWPKQRKNARAWTPRWPSTSRLNPWILYLCGLGLWLSCALCVFCRNREQLKQVEEKLKSAEVRYSTMSRAEIFGDHLRSETMPTSSYVVVVVVVVVVCLGLHS